MERGIEDMGKGNRLRMGKNECVEDFVKGIEGEGNV